MLAQTSVNFCRLGQAALLRGAMTAPPPPFENACKSFATQNSRHQMGSECVPRQLLSRIKDGHALEYQG
eukprot:3120068-Amphidinium_carterae.1